MTTVARIAITFPRTDGGPGPVESFATSNFATLDEYRPHRPSMHEALRRLRSLGFVVTAEGRMTASVRGPTDLFERVFGANLAVFQVDAGLGRASQDTVTFPAAGSPWTLPNELRGFVDDAYIQWPHIYMERFPPPPSPSPLPPFAIGGHHLRVPGDIAALMGASTVHRTGVTGRGVRVAMIDSGFAHGHPYFVEHGYRVSTVLAPGATHGDRDGNGHGTGESANLLAVAPDATFVGVKLDNEDDPWASATILEGLQEALRHEPQVISVSMGYDLRGRSSLPNNMRALEAEIRAAVADGIVVVFAAGNGHVAFPGMMSEVISAGGVHVKNNGEMEASDYASAFDSAIYPGRAVPDFCGLVGMQPTADYILLPVPAGCELDQSTSPPGTPNDDGWGLFSGTSAAAPQLAGVCALLLQANPELTPSEVRAILARTSRDVTRGAANPASNPGGQPLPAGPGRDGATGFGLVDARAAVAQAL